MSATVRRDIDVCLFGDDYSLTVEAEVSVAPGASGRQQAFVVNGDCAVLQASGQHAPFTWNGWWYEPPQQELIREALLDHLENEPNPWEAIDPRI